MDNKNLKDLAQNPDFIPGIYNYCDRWCEKCPFTSKCLNYAMQKERFSESTGDMEKDNEVFWQELVETLDDTIRLLKDLMKERGIDIDDIAVDEEYEKKEEDIRNFTKAHPLTKMADDYIRMAEVWIKRMQPGFVNAGIYLENTEEPLADRDRTSGIRDTLDIIRWYQYQISVKIQRGLQGKQRAEEFNEDTFMYDANGSVKVALLGIDRSLAAWKRMTVFYPNEEDPVIDIMILLGRLRGKTEKEFPGARKFVRPGFDDR